MLDNIPILTLLTFSPLLGIIAVLLIPKEMGHWLKTAAIVSTLVSLVLAGWMFIGLDHDLEGMQYEEKATWIEIALNQEAPNLNAAEKLIYQFNYSLGADGLSGALAFLTALISSMAAFASVHIKKRWKTFYLWFLILQIGMFGVFLSRDLFLFFLFFEATLIPMFFLIGIWGFSDREKAANKFLIYNGIGSAIMLIAFLMLINTAGFSTPQEDPTQPLQLIYSGDVGTIYQNLQDPGSYANVHHDRVGTANPFYMGLAMKEWIFLMLLIAFGIKLPIFPFHTWMLKVHIEAPPSVVMIHSGILLKMGAYGLLRFGVELLPEQAQTFALLIGIVGVVNILYGAVLALVQKEFRLILAYSSISHMGIVLLGIAALNVTGLQGAAFQLVSHGLISALLFLIVGSIIERTNTTELNRLGGLAKAMPFMSGMLLVGGLASLGLPGMSGFVSEFLAFLGLFETMPVLAIVGALGIIITAVYVLRGVLAITYGQLPEKFQEDGTVLRDARLTEAIPMIVLTAFIVLLGIYPSVLSEPLHHALSSMLARIGG